MIKYLILKILKIFDLYNQLKIFRFLKKKNYKTFRIFFDIGAHKGESIILFSKNFQINTIYSFEPSPKNFQKLTKNKHLLQSKFKHLKIPKFLGYLSMFLFFVLGRMIAIDINAGRLLEKWINFFDYKLYDLFSLDYIGSLFILGTSSRSVIFVFILFIFFEFLQVKYSKKQSYHFFRKPLISVFLFLMTILFGFNSMELLYARI